MDAKRQTLPAAAIMASAILLCQGCATIARGSGQKIPVTSRPVGARLLVDGRDMGTTPLVLNLKRRRPAVIRIEKQGYSPHEIRIKRNRPSAFSWGQPISYGFCGGLVMAYFLPLAVHDFDEKIGYRGSTTGWFLLGGLVGATAAGLFPLTDAATGAAYSLSPISLDVFLLPVRDRPGLSISIIDEARLRHVTWLRIRAASLAARDIT